MLYFDHFEKESKKYLAATFFGGVHNRNSLSLPPRGGQSIPPSIPPPPENPKNWKKSKEIFFKNHPKIVFKWSKTCF